MRYPLPTSTIILLAREADLAPTGKILLARAADLAPPPTPSHGGPGFGANFSTMMTILPAPEAGAEPTGKTPLAHAVDLAPPPTSSRGGLLCSGEFTTPGITPARIGPYARAADASISSCGGSDASHRGTMGCKGPVVGYPITGPL